MEIFNSDPKFKTISGLIPFIQIKIPLMNFYQQKWIDTLNNAHLQGWKISPQGDNIFIEMPNVTDIKLIRDNIPSTLAAMSLDIEEARHRLKFIFHNGHEQFEYLLNPGEEDLNEE